MKCSKCRREHDSMFKMCDSCREKARIYNKFYANKYPDKKKNQAKRHYAKHKEKIIQRVHDYNAENKEKIAERVNKYYEKNKDKILDYCKTYYEMNREQRLNYQKEYHINYPDRIKRRTAYYTKMNKEKIRISSISYRAKNKERLNKKDREYRKNNPDKIAEHGANRRARKKNAFVSTVRRNDIFDRDGWVCQLCGDTIHKNIKYPDPFSPSIDHILPLSKGGAHCPENVQSSHLICNSRKNRFAIGQTTEEQKLVEAVDILSAQALGRTEAEELTGRVYRSLV